MKYRIFLYVILINAYWTKHENCIKIVIVLMRICFHKYDEWIFEQDFVDGKAKFAEKSPIYPAKASSEYYPLIPPDVAIPSTRSSSP